MRLTNVAHIPFRRFVFAKSILVETLRRRKASLEKKKMETDRSIRGKRSSNPLVYHDIDAFRSKVEPRQRLTKFKFQAKRYQTIAHQTEKTMIKPIIQLLLVAQSCYYNYVFVSKKKFMIQHLACCSECKNVCTADVENGL